ncbi:MAG: TfoX/Sxy family protein [Chloroflexota bacterium]|nr:TfoX/Sxy family protein [Chloroflexota bacterium]MDE2920991.1 TfoX/Sxy family protein [Chloroflexota bacterium]
MAYDEGLAQRIHEVLAGDAGLTERRMFGGVAFMLHGNMAVGISGDELMVRVGPEAYDEALTQPHARVFDMTGRVMRGWVVVEADGVADDAALNAWVQKGAEFARSLPAK